MQLSKSLSVSLEHGKKTRIEVLDALRGLAALFVVWGHFTNGQGLLQEGWLKTSGSYGWLSVDCFFVISGFVIPLSMYRGEFELLKDWKTFFSKRIIRLDPPYIVSIIVTISLWYVSTMMPGFAGQAPNISLAQLISHLGYLNAFIGYDWINPVFWTLAIEFQYYILIAFFYVCITSQNVRIRLFSTLGLGCLSFLPIGNTFILHFMVVFAFGILTFQYYVKLIKKNIFFVSLLILYAICFFSLGNLVAIVSIVVSLLIAFVRVKIPRLLSFFGMISYSIYLFHVPIGGRIVNLGRRFADTLSMQILVLLCALVVTIGASYLIYLWVEKPAQYWSASLQYNPKTNRQSNFEE